MGTKQVQSVASWAHHLLGIGVSGTFRIKEGNKHMHLRQ